MTIVAAMRCDRALFLLILAVNLSFSYFIHDIVATLAARIDQTCRIALLADQLLFIAGAAVSAFAILLGTLPSPHGVPVFSDKDLDDMVFTVADEQPQKVRAARR